MSVEQHNLLVRAKLNAANFVQGTTSISRGLSNLSGRINKFSTVMAVGVTAPLVLAGRSALMLASDLESAQRRFSVSFGRMGESAESWQQSISSSLGRTETELKSSLVSFNSFFKGLGFAGGEASVLSTKLADLSLDLASFFNIQDAAASKKFLAALAGSPEVLDQYGINLKEAALRQELLNMGITTSVQKTDEFTKTVARLSIIERVVGQTGILGFASENMDTFANRTKELTGRFKALGVTLGKEFLPVASKALTQVSKFVVELTKLSTVDKAKILGVAAALIALPLALKGLSLGLKALSLLTSRLGLIVSAGFAILSIADALNKMSQASNNVKVPATLTNLFDDYKELSKSDAINKVTRDIEAQEKAIQARSEKLKESGGQGFFKAMTSAAASQFFGIDTDGMSRDLDKLKELKEVLSNPDFNMSGAKTLTDYLKDSFVGDDSIIGQAMSSVNDFANDMVAKMGLSFSEIQRMADTLDLVPKQALKGVGGSAMGEGIEAFGRRMESKYTMITLKTKALGQTMVDTAEKMIRELNAKTEWVYDSGRNIGKALGDGMKDGIAVAKDDMQSLMDGLRGVLTNSIVGTFEALGGLIGGNHGKQFKSELLGVLGSAFTAVGSVVTAFGVAMLNFQASATTLNPIGVIAAGGAMVAIGAAISTTAKQSFGGSASSASSVAFRGQQSTGQSSFNQQLVAQVSGDQLRFVLQESDRSRFRRNG